MAETKSVNFDHNKGFITGNGECIGYHRSNDDWQAITSTVYKILDGKCPSELNEWSDTVSAYKTGDVVKYNESAYYCLHDNIPSLHAVESNPKIWRDYSYAFKDIKRGDLLITYARYYNQAKNSENLLEDWGSNSVLISSEQDFKILDKTPYRIQSDVSSEAAEHSLGQHHYFNEAERICLSAYVQQNVSRTVGLGFKFLNEKSEISYIARFDIQTGTTVDIKAYDKSLNETSDTALLKDLSTKIQIIDAETYTYRISIFATTTRESYLECKIFLVGDAPNYDVKFVSSLLTGFHIINCNYIQIEKTDDTKPSAYIATSDKPKQGYSPRKLFQKNGNGFTEYKELSAKFTFTQNLKDIHEAVDGDYAFVSNGLYTTQGAILGTLDTTQEEIEPLLYKNSENERYTVSSNTETYRLKTPSDVVVSLVNPLTFNKYGLERYCGYYRVC